MKRSRMLLKEKCQKTEQEWEEQQKTYQLEMEAVLKALAILSSDDAHESFARTCLHVWPRTERPSHKWPHSPAAGLLKAIAERVHGLMRRRSMT